MISRVTFEVKGIYIYIHIHYKFKYIKVNKSEIFLLVRNLKSVVKTIYPFLSKCFYNIKLSQQSNTLIIFIKQTHTRFTFS